MISVAVLGCGYWGPNLLRNFSDSPLFRVVACADMDAGRVQRVATQYPAVRFTTDYEEIYRDANIDAVVIATPAQTHYELARDALLCGKHVLVEKPLTTTVAHGEELKEIAKRKNLTLMVDHTFVYTGAIRKIREIIDSGQLGKLYYFDSVRINLGLWRHDTNVLWDLAPHDLSIMNNVLQRQPVAVSASGQGHTTRIVDVAYLTTYFEDETIAHFHCNWLAPVKVRQIIIGGDKRLVIYDDSERSEKVKVYDRGIDVQTSDERYSMLVQYRSGDMYAPKLDPREALSIVCEHFGECIKQGTEPITGADAGLMVVRTLEAAERSLVQESRKMPLVGVGEEALTPAY